MSILDSLSGRRLACDLRVFALAAVVALASPGVNAAEAAKKTEPSQAEATKKVEPSQADIEQQLEAARKRLDAAAREVADLSMKLSGDVMPEVMPFPGFGAPKAVLGINLGGRGDKERADGVEVVSVSPGGAAAQAGLKAGDVLVEVNGKTLKSDDSGSARRKLLDAMRDVDPGDKVALSYRRDGKVAKASVTAQPLENHFFTRALRVPGVPGVPAVGAVTFGPGRFAFMRADGVFGSAELVSLTPKLGEYFGTDKGLLVVRAPEDARLKLEDGDVIMDIDGRTPSSASHALRILSSYQAGEKLTLNVLRARKKMSFQITIPEDSTWEKRLDDASFMPQDVLEGVPPLPPEPARIHIQPQPTISVSGETVDGPV
jgi:C-terminal processing protease CtpA/Prc